MYETLEYNGKKFKAVKCKERREASQDCRRCTLGKLWHGDWVRCGAPTFVAVRCLHGWYYREVK